jgi:hypothetical protein
MLRVIFEVIQPDAQIFGSHADHLLLIEQESAGSFG